MSISVEVIKLDPITMKKTSTIIKKFVDRTKFFNYYKTIKDNQNLLINIRFYDVDKNPRWSAIFDSRLLTKTNIPFILNVER